MLIYVEGQSFLGRTFVVMCREHDTVARIKAKLLHSLHDWGKSAYQFRLRYKTRFLQDAVSLEDQGVVENGVLQMVPLYKDGEVNNSAICSKIPMMISGLMHDTPVVTSLQLEVGKLEKRVTYHSWLKALVYLQLLVAPFLFAAVEWWAGFWSCLFALYGVFFLPYFYYVGGVATVPNVLHFRFLIIVVVLSSLTLGAGAALWVRLLTESSTLLDGCKSANSGQDVSLASDSCSSKVWYSAIIHPIQILINVLTVMVAMALGFNLKFKIGDLLEASLLLLGDIEQAIAVAQDQDSSASAKHNAAAQINSFVGTSDDAKFQVVELEGLLSLINLTLAKEEDTQIMAAEALAMMLEVPAIQDEFVKKNGMSCLGALLRSDRPQVQTHACRAMSLMVTDNAENAELLAEGNGLSDIASAMNNVQPETGEYVATILKHLAAQSVLRSAVLKNRDMVSAILQEASNPSDVEALTASCLHLTKALAMESDSILFGQRDLVTSLLSMPRHSGNLDVLQPSAKLLLCYVENEQLLPQVPLDELKQTLSLLVSTHDKQLMYLCVEIVCSLASGNRDGMEAHNFNQVISEVLQVVQESTSQHQHRDARNVQAQNIDTRADFDKELGTAERPAIDEGDEDVDEPSSSVRQPLLASGGGGGWQEKENATGVDRYPELQNMAQQVYTSLAVQQRMSSRSSLRRFQSGSRLARQTTQGDLGRPGSLRRPASHRPRDPPRSTSAHLMIRRSIL